MELLYRKPKGISNVLHDERASIVVRLGNARLIALEIDLRRGIDELRRWLLKCSH